MLLEVEAAGLDLGEVQDVVDDAQQRRRRVAHGAERLALLERERRALQHVDHAQNAVHRRADLVAHRGEEGRLGLVGALGLALRVDGDVARMARLVVGDLQAAREVLLLVGERDVVVLPAMDVAHIGHEMADIGAAGDADELVERIDRGQQHEQQRRRRRDGEGVEGRRMGRADRHRRGDGRQQHQAQQHALQLVVLGGEHDSPPTPQQAPARNERLANHQPQRMTSSSGGLARLKLRRRTSKPSVTATWATNGAGELDQLDLAPVDGRDHRPQHEREVARLRRALEQAADEFGADEGFLPRRRGWLGLGYRLSRDDGHRPSSAPRRGDPVRLPCPCADRLTDLACRQSQSPSESGSLELGIETIPGRGSKGGKDMWCACGEKAENCIKYIKKRLYNH